MLSREIERSSLFNKDLAPTSAEQRTWSAYHFMALWVGMSVCIPTYMLASGLVAGGMNWWQAILTIFLGNVIVLIPMVLNAHAGAKYGIPFPVLARASFGTLGSNIPALLRALVACGWFGIQTWIGGQAIHAMLSVLWPAWGASRFGPWTSFAIFWLINIAVIIRGIESIKFLEAWSAPFMILVGLVLLAWAVRAAQGFGPIMRQPSKFQSSAEFFKFFVPALTGMVGFWATLALNIPDFTRYARNQKAQILGQTLGLPITMTLYSFIGIVVTSASAVVFGEPIWDPVVLLAKFKNPWVTLISMLALLIATLTTNVAANVVSPANDFSNLWPTRISFKVGGLLTGVIGIAIMPWKLLSDYGAYIFGWLVGYSGFLGPVAGVLLSDYFLLRKRTIAVEDLYLRGGIYEYSKGYNGRAIWALFLGIGVALVGLLIPALRWLYDYAWFAGFFTSGALYYLLMSDRMKTG
ncbi:MAG: nitrate reductase [Acidobacteria bacterium]|nr:MAG: nitrate reductase [Acidobacteriota bacterium]PYV00195.1 MAG: nitrate reductase [Acidobacteriota bacterium]PYV42181.1 MAG: nitrate reductase [Acidobacteriota bacterium]